MAEEKIEVSIDGLLQLQSAVRDFAHGELDQIVLVVIKELRSRPAEGIFEDVHARHLWDEYCWARQEGPFEDPTFINGAIFGSMSDAFDGLLHDIILAEVEKLPNHAQVFLSALGFEQDIGRDKKDCLGCIWIDGIVNAISTSVNECASRRNLDFFGPHRSDTIRYEIEGVGFVWPLLDREEAMNLVSEHVDAIVDPVGDLFPLAEEMVEAFLADAGEYEYVGVFLEFFKHFEGKLRSMIRDEDALPSLHEMRRKFLEAWDG